ncbi:hypothetical protein [Occallatibacter riparius]|uniref:Uncharacterized protein n=1 Tax=Occallatibacter riparius TaxID=1002689 RepID=A0A9J7BUC4_9BACT|nr:hypothetical protein [Occallatibacter riparius]UWZ85338.1 hypothetical protein MOP44_05215 [Occallatibacter riparius]
MKAAAAHIHESEKHARLGLEPHELQDQIARWPNIDDHAENSIGFLAINNCLNEISHGLRLSAQEWDRWFDTPLDEIESTYDNWLRLKGTRGGIR